ncbi:MAG: hypothetical protein CMM56_05335 [Rhodospirillaceae bacterium]|nr:hypothetical protein [Rhodospirillaceae bacterium]|tara:strand:+ start:9155 stop:9802 length:648 start_codon:yes stop_codon:yes gene_type:complete
MSDLRWVLLSLGLLLLVALYLWPLLLSKISSRSSKTQIDSETLIHEDDGLQVITDNLNSEVGLENSRELSSDSKIVTLRFIPSNKKYFDAEETILALRSSGLKRGKYGIFHYSFDESLEELDIQFSVANLTEPGSFDLTNIEDSTISGMSFFFVLHRTADPIASFDLMVKIAKELKQKLEAELLDEDGSSWSIQRERYIREEIIQHCHKKSKAPQ